MNPDQYRKFLSPPVSVSGKLYWLDAATQRLVPLYTVRAGESLERIMRNEFAHTIRDGEVVVFVTIHGTVVHYRVENPPPPVLKLVQL